MTAQSIHVAILDDDAAVGKALCRLLRTAEMVVDTYASSSPFLESLAHGHPDCLVLDLQMPGLTGVDVLQYLDRRHISIPTVVITAHDTEESREACLNAGALAYLPKPLDAGQLVAAIVKICEASSAGRAGS